jgi:hypothetical protein
MASSNSLIGQKKKADGRDADHETLVYEIYSAAESMADHLSNDKKLLIEQWVNAYSNVPHTSVEKIKKEVNMSYTATTISEHIWNEGKMEGVIEGEIKGQIKILESLYLSAVLRK